MNTPNLLTLIRIILIPVFMLVFYLPFHWSGMAAAILFALACVTDWLDGYLARIWQQTSVLGAFLDPVADKLLVAVALVLLVGAKDIPFISVPAAIIVGREIVISALREWMAELGKRTSMAVSYIGKVKTTIQMIAVFLLLAFKPATSWIGVIGFVMLYSAAILTIWSMCIYLKLAWPDLMAKN